MSTASRPFDASATTIRSTCLEKNCRKPARTMAWSSMMAILIMMEPASSGAVFLKWHKFRAMSFLSRFRRNIFAFPLAALAALAMLAISEASYQDATASLDALGQRADARSNLNALVKGLLDAETGERGYLLTKRTEYLGPYRRGVL